MDTTPPLLMTGHYKSHSGVLVKFDAYQAAPDTVMIILKGQSGEIARLFPMGKGEFFHVTNDVFNQFKRDVINRNVSWIVTVPVTIPGTWTSDATSGGKRHKRSGHKRSGHKRSSHKKRSGHKKRKTRRRRH